MNSPTTLQMTDLISVSEAANLVPYSRDHITRLAREGKIIATQTTRRWLVSAVSLQRFYESCRHEDAVRQQYLSEARRRDLEVAEELRREQAQVKAAAAVGTPSSWYSATVILSGLFCGVLLHASLSSWLAHFDSAVRSDSPQTVAASHGSAQVASVGSAVANAASDEASDRTVTSGTRELSLENGIVLLPMMASSTVESEDFFSDEVEIEMVSNTEGVVRLSNSPDAPALTVLRLPGASETEVTTRGP